MPTIRQMLDAHGLPPNAVAIDWAWQIREAVDRMSERNASDPASSHHAGNARDVLDEIDWTRWQIETDGSLALTPFSLPAAQSALADLQVWSQGSSRQAVPDFVCQDLDQSSSTLAGPRRQIPAHSARAKRLPVRTILATGAVLLFLSFLGLALMSRPGSSMQGNRVEVAANARSAADNADYTTDQRIATERDAVAVDASLAIDSLDAPSPGIESLEQWMASQPVADTLSRLAPPAELLDSIASPHNSIGPTKTIDADRQLLLGENVESSEQVASVDVMQQVQEVMHKVAEAAQAAESARATGAAHATDGQLGHAAESTQNGEDHSAWVLSRSAPHRHQTPPKSLRPKPRQAIWHVRIEEVDGLICEPSWMQSVGPREQVTWRIYDETRPSPRTCLLIHAQQPSSRECDIQMRLSGSSDDLPGLVLPVDTKWIDALKSVVQRQANQAQAQLDWLQQQPVPSQLKQPAYATRQWLSSQVKLSLRIATILAEVDQLAELMDGQIVCHVQLHSETGESPDWTWGEP